MIRVAFVEDEEHYRKQLHEYAQRFSDENNVEVRISEFANGIQITDNFKADYDVIFLDVQMPMVDGFETAHRIRRFDQDVLLVFVTNMAQFALKGYEVNAYDYVVKPLSYPAFEMKMKKIVRILSRRPAQYILLPLSGSMQKIPTSDVYYIETLNHKLYCHTVDGVKVMSFGTLSAWERRLEAEHFSRCNSCYLVNLRHVTDIRTDYVLVGGEELKISRPRKKIFLEELTAYAGEG